MNKKYVELALPWHWARTAVFLLLFGENTRLVLTLGATPRRLIVMTLVGSIFAYSLIMLIRALRQRAKDKQPVPPTPAKPRPSD